MVHLEIDSFVKKFEALWSAGLEASLSLESKLGELCISLNCKVGRPLPPPMSPTAPSVTSSKYRSPSYFRRQVRRRKSRESQNVMIDPFKSNEDGREGTDSVNTHDWSQDKSDVTEDLNSSDVTGKAIGDAMPINNNIDEKITEEVEHNLEKLADEFVIRVMTEPLEKKELVEQEIKEKFSLLGVKIERLNTFSNVNGFFEMCRVKTSPVKLKKVWGRQLGVKNCSVNVYEPQKSYN